MGVKPKKAAGKEVSSKRAEEAKKKEMVHGDKGIARLAVLDAVHVTGVLASRELARDVRIEQVTMSLHGRELIQDTTVQINFGRKYGLIGANGSGKSTLLAALACRELPIPDNIDIWFVHQEAAPEAITAIAAVVDTAAKEYARLEALIQKLCEEDAEGNSDIMEALGDKLDKMDPTSFIPDAGQLLHGLGFTEQMMYKETKDMSGGWRMRVALAQALFKKPTLLILDEPTNHLDLGACVWLEEYLAVYPFTIILTSHSEDFMNTVCTEIMQLTQNNELVYWGGNFASYINTREETEVNQMKAYEKEQSDIAHLQEFIRSCGTYSNMRRQADSKQKIIDKMKEKGLTTKPMPDQKFMFNFPDSESLPPPVLAFDNMSFSYSGKKQDYLYSNVDFGIDLDTRVALVGPNGAGKSTLLKLMRGDIEPCEGQVKRHNHLRIASYNQHSAEVLPMDKTPLEFLMEKYDAEDEARGDQKRTLQQWRALCGKYGLNGDLQMRKLQTFSDGQRARLVFAVMSLANPHLLLLDEPTNHLDMACIDALAEAIMQFSGGTVLVSHDFRLIDRVATEIWICDNAVTPWKGDIKAYKAHLSKAMKKSARDRLLAVNSGASIDVVAKAAALRKDYELLAEGGPTEPEPVEVKKEEKPAEKPAEPVKPAKAEPVEVPKVEEPELPPLPEPELVPLRKKDDFDECEKLVTKKKSVEPEKLERKKPEPKAVEPRVEKAKKDEPPKVVKADKKEKKDEPELEKKEPEKEPEKKEPEKKDDPEKVDEPEPVKVEKKAKSDEPKEKKAVPPWLRKR